MDATCIATMLQAGGGNMMVWGMISIHSLNPLIHVQQHLNKTSYLSIILDHVLLCYVDGFSDLWWLLINKINPSSLSTGIVHDWFEEHEKSLLYLGGPHNPQISVPLTFVRWNWKSHQTSKSLIIESNSIERYCLSKVQYKKNQCYVK